MKLLDNPFPKSQLNSDTETPVGSEEEFLNIAGILTQPLSNAKELLKLTDGAVPVMVTLNMVLFMQLFLSVALRLYVPDIVGEKEFAITLLFHK